MRFDPTDLDSMRMVVVFWWSQLAASQAGTSSLSAETNTDLLIDRPFIISTASINEAYPAMAYNPVDREYLEVLRNVHPCAMDDIYAQRIPEQGKLFSWFYVADGLYPRVAYNQENNTYLVVYTKWVSSDYDVYAQRVDYTGSLGLEFPVAIHLNQMEEL